MRTALSLGVHSSPRDPLAEPWPRGLSMLSRRGGLDARFSPPLTGEVLMLSRSCGARFAVGAFAKLLQRNPNFVAAHYRAVLLSELGSMKEAREAWDKASAISPEASIPNLRERLPYKRPADLERFLAGAHRAGMA